MPWGKHNHEGRQKCPFGGGEIPAANVSEGFKDTEDAG